MPQFPLRDFTNQYISNSYQDVLQQYLPSGDTLYILDGLGNVIFSFPSSSYGQDVLTSDRSSSMSVATASYALFAVSSSFTSTSSLTLLTQSNVAISASWASQSLVSISSSWASHSLSSISSSWSAFSVSSSFASTGPFTTLFTSSTYQITSSWSNNSISSSYALTSSFALNAAGGTNLITGSTYPITSSWSNNAITASYLIYPSSLVLAPTNGTVSIVQQTASLFNSIFINYNTNDGRNFRAGQVVVIYNTSSANLNETTTIDIGNSTGLTIVTNVSNSFVNVLASNATANNYNIKFHYDIL